MSKIFLIAVNTFREILRKRVIYLALFLGFLITLSTASSMAFIEMAEEASEFDYVSDTKTQVVTFTIEIWFTVTALMTIVLSSTLIAGEAKSKTIVNTMSRPVSRAQFLVGKWMGVQAFVTLFLIPGFLFGVGLALMWDLDFSLMFWVSIGRAFVETTFLCAVSLGLSTMVTPVVAGLGAVSLLDIAPQIAVSYLNHSNVLYRSLALVLYYCAPALLPEDVQLAESFSVELLDPNYGLYLSVLGENILYAMAVFIAGTVIFTRGDLPLK